MLRRWVSVVYIVDWRKVEYRFIKVLGVGVKKYRKIFYLYSLFRKRISIFVCRFKCDWVENG